LDWPIGAEAFDELTFEYEPEELGIDARTAARIEEIKQLRPLATGQPWGVFFIRFEPKRLPVVVLRRILSQLVVRKRASAKKSDLAAWNLHDLLFISNYGEGADRQITFAHFTQDAATGDLPTLKVLGWDDADTALHISHVHHELQEKLRWPENEKDLDGWRERWSSAFTLRHRQVITTSKDLAGRLAALARLIRRRADQVLNVETERGPLRRLHKAFREALIHDLSEEDFADMYAQTIAYGLLAARLSRPMGIIAENVADMVPVTNPFLRDMLGTFLTIGGRKGKIDFDELGIQDVVDLLNSPDTRMEAIVRDFGNRTRQEDPVIHFYELFLAEYDKKMKVKRGVFYTPQPVVSYIVRSVHELLQTEFGLTNGLADTTTWGEMAKRNPAIKIPEGVSQEEPFVQILDIATGTATFLVEVIDVIHKTMTAKWRREGRLELEFDSLWNEYVPKRLLPRLYGYELLMAPYAIAHMKIGLKLYETGYRFGSDERVHVYLTNALEPPSPLAEEAAANLFEALGHEAQAVNAVKRDKRFTVLIGNPPYAGWSANLSPAMRTIVECYKFIGTDRIREKGALQFEKNLQDDYVKFFAWTEQASTTAGVGILSLISNNGFLETPTLRGMRWHLLSSFSQLFLFDLHGSTKRPIKADESVFDIQQGVSISLFCRALSSPAVPSVKISDLVGERNKKYAYLLNHTVRTTPWKSVTPLPPLFQFIDLDCSLHVEYNSYPTLVELMPFYSTGTETGFDGLLVDFTEEELLAKIRRFVDSRKTDAEIETEFSVGGGTARKLLEMRKEFKNDFELNGPRYCVRGTYRVFDRRAYYFKKEYLKTNSLKVMRNLLETQNRALIAFRQQSQGGFHHIFVTKELGDKNAVSLRTREINYYFPLRILPDRDGLTLESSPSLNFNAEFLKELTGKFGIARGGRNGLAQGLAPEDIFHYIYGVFHSPTYRTRYAQFLKIDFPRLPLTSSLVLFHELARLGCELVAIHLVEAPEQTGISIRLDKIGGWTYAYATPPPVHVAFTGPAEPVVDKVGWSDNTVWIDAVKPKKGVADADLTGKVGFRGVPEEVWNFHIGGYQVCEKWLKDRKGRTLGADDLIHYHRIVVALHETIRLMAEIDRVIDAHGGWPLK